ncbi:FKBP-type peptidyl-prolyl isomerase [Citrobacter freundii]|nr:FKBP-type peptidyl-prolyl isomerase [Citrobacter freundii]
MNRHHKVLQQIICVFLLLVTTGNIYAREKNTALNTEQGIPGVLRYAQQQREAGTVNETEKKQTPSVSLTEKQSLIGSNNLRHRLNLQEQSIRQLKKENRILRNKINEASGITADSVDMNKQISALNVELDKSQKQQEKMGENTAQLKKQLDSQITDLKQKLSQASVDSQIASAQALKEKAELNISLDKLKKEMATMPVVTTETLSSESAQQTYAAGVVLGRDMLNLQAASKQLGMNTDNHILVAGIWDALNQKVKLNESVLDTSLRQAEAIAQKARQKIIQEQKKIGAEYLAKFRKQKGVKQAGVGYWYDMEYVGDGGVIQGEDTVVDVVVSEKLTDGTVVEDMDTRGQVISQPLSEYPPLFRSALILMKNHGTMKLVVPSELAYGDEGYPPKILPGSTMIYILRVEDVKQVETKGNKVVEKDDSSSTGSTQPSKNRQKE